MVGWYPRYQAKPSLLLALLTLYLFFTPNQLLPRLKLKRRSSYMLDAKLSQGKVTPRYIVLFSAPA